MILASSALTLVARVERQSVKRRKPSHQREKYMHISHHAGQRMNQRGISRRILDFTLPYRRLEGDRRVVDRKESQRIIDRLNEELRVAKQILEKGGVAVIDERDVIITTYNLNARSSSRMNARANPRIDHA
jgi:hypothetical protein